jgi:hypothetical protein
MPLTNAPRILRGAFVEYGLSIPPLFVVFQFNPVELTRNRTLTFGPENAAAGEGAGPGLRAYHERTADLLDVRDGQRVDVAEEAISFDIRLDATDRMNEGDPIAAAFGVLPQLATLELMVHPKAESLLGAAVDAVFGLGDAEGFSSARKPNPPLVLFIWGHKRVLPVNVTRMNVTETEFSTLLDPTRATVSVSLSVIEGSNPFFTYSKVAKEVSAVLNLASIPDVANVVIPG